MKTDGNSCVVCVTGEYPLFPHGDSLCEKHNVCISCGINRSRIKHTPWGARNGAFQCAPCEKSERQAAIKKRILAGFEHEYEDEVVCPHCGYKHSDSWEMGEGENKCPDCDKTFTMERYASVTYSTEKPKDKQP